MWSWALQNPDSDCAVLGCGRRSSENPAPQLGWDPEDVDCNDELAAITLLHELDNVTAAGTPREQVSQSVKEEFRRGLMAQECLLLLASLHEGESKRPVGEALRKGWQP